MPAAPTTQIESRPTVDPARVFVMEDHDQAVQVWRSAGAELATVAYSVTGGYTPLQWKWLGDAAALRLRGAGPEALKPMRLMREAAIAERKNRNADAELLYREALALDARSAAARFRFALLQRRAGRIHEARNLFREAVSLDPSYGTPYRSRGFFCQASRMHLEAEAEHRTALDLNEEDPFPHLGLAQPFASQKRYLDADPCLGRAIELDPQLVDAYCEWGDVLRHLGRYEDAVSAYEKYLQLALLGRRTMIMPICTAEPATFQLDARHFRVHARRADALFKLGKLEDAEQGFRMNLAAGDRRPKVRMGLARASWRIGSRNEAVRHAMASIAAYYSDSGAAGPQARCTRVDENCSYAENAMRQARAFQC